MSRNFAHWKFPHFEQNWNNLVFKSWESTTCGKGLLEDSYIPGELCGIIIHTHGLTERSN